MFFQQMIDHKFQDEDLKLIIHTAVTEEQKAEHKYTHSDSDTSD